MNEMIELYHESLLLGPPGSFDNEKPGSFAKQEEYPEEGLSPTKNFETIPGQPAKKDSSLMERMELPVNNFLKTLKEIEAEFYFVFSSIKIVLNEIPDSFDTFGRMMKKNEANMSAAGMELSGYMEENY
jgi:hypothetical protein